MERFDNDFDNEEEDDKDDHDKKREEEAIDSFYLIFCLGGTTDC